MISWPWQYYSTDRFAHPLALNPEEDPEQEVNWMSRPTNEGCWQLMYSTAMELAEEWLPDIGDEEREKIIARTMTADCMAAEEDQRRLKLLGGGDGLLGPQQAILGSPT